MHRHGYKGRKFHRERDQRKALIQSLAESLIKYESIETTLPKAKEVMPYVERLITKAKKGDLHNRRQIIADLQTIETAHKLVDQIAPKLKGRTSGHLRIERTTMRRGSGSAGSRAEWPRSNALRSVRKISASVARGPLRRMTDSAPGRARLGTGVPSA